jgi:hypothetical protein
MTAKNVASRITRTMPLCQVLPDAEEERPPYFAAYGNVDFAAIEQVNKRIVGQPTARKNS